MSTPRANVNQQFHLGVEASPGVGGTAHNHLGTLSTPISPVAAGAFGIFRPSGGKYVGQVVPVDTYAEGAITDTIDFNTTVFMLASNVGTDGGTPDGGGAFTYRCTPVPFGDPASILTYIVQEGQAGAVYNYSNVLVPDLSYRYMRTGASQTTGRFLGRRLPPGDALTTATLVQGRALSGVKVGLWTADSWTALLGGGATRMDPIGIDFNWRHNGVFAPWFGLDDSINSFAGTLPQQIDSGAQITVIADVDAGASDIAGRFNLTSMDEGTRIYLKMLAYGAIIHDAVRYSMEGNFNLVISGPPRRSTSGPARVWQWDCVCEPEFVGGELTVPFDWTVVNTLDPSAFAV